MHLHKPGKRSLSLLISLTVLFVLALAAPGLPAAAQAGPRVAIEPPQVTVEAGQEFTVAAVVEGVTDLGAYEVHLRFDPAVVEVLDVEQGGFLESSGRSIIALGPDIDAGAGTAVVAAVSLGQVPGPDGGGELAVFTLRAVGPGESDLDLLEGEGMLLDTASGRIQHTLVDGRVRVGSGTAPTPAPTTDPGATGTPTATPTEGAPDDAPTATPAEGLTPSATPTEESTMPGATATNTVTGAGTSTPVAAAEGTPGETHTSEATEVPQTEEAEEEASSTSTATPAAGATDAPTASAPQEGEAPAQRSGLAGRRGWLVGAAVALAILGAALIGGGAILFRGQAQVDGDAFVEDEIEMDDGSM